MHTFSTEDLGAAALARAILRSNPSASLCLQVGGEADNKLLSRLWSAAIKAFPEAAVLINQHSKDALNWAKREKREIFSSVLLKDFAQEGLANSVEFRRLARKFLRPVKHANKRELIVIETVLCDKSALKVLRHIAGSQLQIIPATTFLDINDLEIDIDGGQQLLVKTKYDPKWTQRRVQEMTGFMPKMENVMALQS